MNQTRTYNHLNELTSITTNEGDVWAETTYDSNGNVTQTPRPDKPTRSQSIVYDAWDRQVALDGQTEDTYAFDGLGRRIQRTVDGFFNDEDYDFFYTTDHQMILHDLEGEQTSFFFGDRYIDDVVFRETNSTPVRYYALDRSSNSILRALRVLRGELLQVSAGGTN